MIDNVIDILRLIAMDNLVIACQEAYVHVQRI